MPELPLPNGEHVTIALSCALLAVLAPAQAPPKPPAFEVASVKRAAPVSAPAARPGAARSTGLDQREDPATVSYTDYPLRPLLMKAYNVKRYQIAGPSWLDTEHYDIVAKPPDGATREQIPAMLQSLLVERFQMTVRRETREQPVYALIVGKNGPNLKKTDKPNDGVGFSTSGHLGAGSVGALANLLSSFMDRPVLDMTGIQGNFDISLDVSMDDLIGLRRMMSTAGAQTGGDAASGSGPAPEISPQASIFTAIQQLGLKLEPRKEPIEMIVIDKAEKVPTEN